MNFALRLPDYYKSEIETLKGNVSINQFIVNAVAEKIATLKTVEHLKQKGLQGSREHGLSILEKSPDREPLDKE
jgi:hypothetical protein